jgi:hypothetical protein
MAAALVALFTWIVLAANAGLAAESGIECGWQPMPDGSASYECVIQVAPELLNSLRRGDSIPLTIDVPEHIRPISRIRLVAGNESLPRQALATNLKPWPTADKKSREGVIETQFTTNTDPRYSTQQATNGAVVPVNGYMADAQTAVTRQLQNGGQAIQNAVGQITQDVLPPDAGRSVTDAVNRAGQELGNNLRSASDNVQNDIRQMFGSAPATGGNSSVLPPASQQTSTPNTPQSQAILPNNANTTGNSRRLDQPVTAPQGNNWQSSQPQPNPATGNNTISPPGNFDSQWASDTRSSTQPAPGVGQSANQNSDRFTNTPSFAEGTILPQNPASSAANQLDRYGNAGQTASADSRSGALGNNQPASSGPSFPPFSPSLGNERSPITPTPVTSSSTPEIRRDMFNQPANAEIQGANGLPIGQQPLNPAQVTVQSPPIQSPLAADNFNWNTKPQTQQTAAPQLAGPVGSTNNSVFPLLLSWVLLSGSGAGNLYLFWSYLDVRNKYHDLVDDAARRISGRRIRD